MIRLRLTLERGRAHPVLGPLLLIALVLLLALLFLHVAEHGWEAALNLGVICVAVVFTIGRLLFEWLDRPSRPLVAVRAGRGPPRLPARRFFLHTALASGPRSLPLRR